MSRLSRYVRRLRDWFVRLLHLDDSAKRIALGAAVGAFVAMTPTIGFQMLLVIFLLWLIPGNRAAGLPVVWLTNPATLVPIYYFNYRVGVVFLGEPAGADLRGDWGRVFKDVPGLGLLLRQPSHWVSGVWHWLGDLWYAMDSIMAQLWLGSVVVGLVAGGVTYVVMYYLVTFYRNRIRVRLVRLAELHALRAHRHAERHHRKGRHGRPEDLPPPEVDQPLSGEPKDR